LRAYRDEYELWVCPDGIVNSTGTLALHLTGNLMHYIGAVLGKAEGRSEPGDGAASER